MVYLMASVSWYGLTETFTKETSRTARDMAREGESTMTGHNTQGSMLMTNRMVEVSNESLKRW